MNTADPAIASCGDLLACQAADLIEQRQTAAEQEQLLVREQAARAEAARANRIKD